MAKHEILMAQSVHDLGKVDTVFDVHIDGLKRGELHISKGGVDWWPRSSKVYKHTLSWTRLAEMLETAPRKPG